MKGSQPQADVCDALYLRLLILHPTLAHLSCLPGVRRMLLSTKDHGTKSPYEAKGEVYWNEARATLPFLRHHLQALCAESLDYWTLDGSPGADAKSLEEIAPGALGMTDAEITATNISRQAA